jgi:hypothetical protein
MSTFVELIAPHADYVSNGVRYCTCGEWGDDSATANSTREPFARHLHQVLMDSGMAVVSLDGLLNICKTVAHEKAVQS